MCFLCYERLQAKAEETHDAQKVKKKRKKGKKSSRSRKKQKKKEKKSDKDDESVDSSASPTVKVVVDDTKTNPDTNAEVLIDEGSKKIRYHQSGSRTMKIVGERDKGDKESTEKKKNAKDGTGRRKKAVPPKDSDDSSSSSASEDENKKDQQAATKRAERKKNDDSDDSSSSSSSDDDSSDDDSTNEKKRIKKKKKKKKQLNLNSLFLGTHSLSIRHATLDDSECALKEDWIESIGLKRKRLRRNVQDDKLLDWLVNTQNSDIALEARPIYKAGSGGVTTFGHKAITTDTVFARPEGILANYGKRRLGEVCLYGTSHAMADLWLKKPMKELQEMICKSRRKKNTRATADELRVGNDLDIASSHIAADSVINPIDDDVELIHYSSVTKDHCYLWHSERFYVDGMLIRAIEAVLRSSDNGIVPVPKEFHPDTEFLGFTEVYRDGNHNIIAFNITAMLLFRYDNKSIDIETAMVARDMGNSSMLERLIQCLQVLHMERTKLPVDDLELTLMIPKGKVFHASDPNYSNNQAHIAYIRGGFKHTQTVPTHNVNYPQVITMRIVKSGGVLLRLAKYTWMEAWLKYYNAISLVAKNDQRKSIQGTKIQRNRKLFFDVINALASEPSNQISRVFPTKLYINRISNEIRSAEDRLPSDLSPETQMRVWSNSVMPRIIKRVAETTQISFGLIMHLVSKRMQKFPGQVSMFETTAELLQGIVIQLVTPCSNMRLFSGDLHTCQLHCTRCARSFGVTGTLDVVLANAQIAILKHHGLCVKYWEKTSSDDIQIDGDETDLSCYKTRDEKVKFLFENVLPPIFASASNLDEAMQQRQRNQEEASKGRIASLSIATCGYGHYDTSRSEEETHNNFLHNYGFTEAVNMDAGYYSADTATCNARVYATSAILGGFFHTALDAHYLYQKLYVGESKTEEWKDYCDSSRQPEMEDDLASKIEKLDKKEHLTYKGMESLCELLDAVFKNNIALALSPAPAGAEMDHNLRIYLNSFFGISDKYKPHTFGDVIKMEILNLEVEVSLDDCFRSRPFQRKVIDTAEQDQPGEGEGWNQPTAITWFEHNPAEEQAYGSSSIQKMAEDEILLQTMTHIKWTTDPDDGHKKYKFKCDMNLYSSDDPSLKAKHKKLSAIKEFDCSQSFVKTFPFKAMSTNRDRWISIYKFLEPRRQHIKKAMNDSVGGFKAIRTQWGGFSTSRGIQTRSG